MHPESTVTVSPQAAATNAPDRHWTGRHWTRIDSPILAGYAVVVAVGIRWHEPWADEAQSWLLARDNSWPELMLHRLHYEGTPGLWHTLLWILVRLHVSYEGMHWFAGGCAVIGIVLLLRFAPFPFWLRALLPFTFWLAYQNAVVARSYVLFTPFAFAAAALLRSPVRRPLAVAAVLGLMANISLHGFVASVGFATAVAFGARREQHSATSAGLVSSWLPAAALLAAFWLGAIVVMYPAPDADFGGARNVERAAAALSGAFGDHGPAAAPATSGELHPQPPVRPLRTHAQAVWRAVAHILGLLTYPLSAIPLLGLAVCAFVVAEAQVSSQIRWLMPWLLMVIVFTVVALRPHHAGMLAVAFVAALWMLWPEQAPPAGFRLWLHRLTLIALAAICLEQISWTLHAVRADVHGHYCGDLATAQFLVAHARGKRVAGFAYESIGPVAWFSGPIYINQPHACWLWSSNARVNAQAPAVLSTRPDFIVYGGADVDPRQGDVSDDWYRVTDPAVPLGDRYGVLAWARTHGYLETHRFCGHAWMRSGSVEALCQVILEPQ